MKKIISMLLIVTMCLVMVACSSSDYKKAEQLYAAADYAAALEIYTALGEYEDAPNKVKQCKYEIANEHLGKKEYAEALEIYTALGEHEDAPNKVKQCKYETANTHFENAEYKAALEIYTEIGEYEDATDKAAYCEREVGMSENADYAFLADIEASVLNRMENSDTNDYAKLVNTELAYVEKYGDKEFYVSELKAIADKYIEGLRAQKDALKKELYWEYQIEWQRGMVLRYEALVDLYNKYDFLTENAEFVGTYVASLEDKQYVLNGYYAIEEDIGNQTKAEDFSWWLDEDDYSFYCTLTNNTEYTFGTFFDVSFMDKNGVVFDTQTAYIENIKPGMTYDVEVYISDPKRIDTFTWSNYYDSID